MPAPPDSPLPVTVVGGYLGAGKTTLVNQLLRQAGGRRLAVLVNDFGELPIDAELIEAADQDVISLAGGCVCCSFGSDLLGAMAKLTRRAPPPDHVLIEASGVALPGTVAASLTLLADVALDGVVVLVDAETVRARAADRYLADTIARQLHAADLLVVNMLDRVSASAHAALHAWLAQMAPRAARLDAVRAQLPFEAVLGADLRRDAGHARPPARLRSGGLRAPAAADTRFERIDVVLERRVDARALAQALAQPALGVIRAKGIVQDLDGATVALHVIGALSEIVAQRSQNAQHAHGARGRLVCIGLADHLEHDAVQSALDRALAAVRH
jgi:G3E family GTPase